MHDYLDQLAFAAMRSIRNGYYRTRLNVHASPRGLKDSLLRCQNAPIISEIKFASPSNSTIRKNLDLKGIARDMAGGGASGISVLTEPRYFKGNITFLAKVRKQVQVPILMKDFIISPQQIDVADKTGASAILLIQSLFERGYCEKPLYDMIEYAHLKGLEVLLEAHTAAEFQTALHTNADMIGINNRNLTTLKVNLDVTKRILTTHSIDEKLVVSESGIHTPDDIRLLRQYGAHAFLIGTTIMQAPNIKVKTQELVNAL